MAARLKRLELFGDIDVQAATATTGLGGVALARHVALSIVDLGGRVGKHIATPAFTSKLGTSQGEALLFAGTQALLGGDGGLFDLSGP